MSQKIRSSEITSEHVYLNRRQFMKTAGILSLGGVVAAACGTSPSAEEAVADVAVAEGDAGAAADAIVDELGRTANTFEEITNYNNYYEFTTDKEDVAQMAANYVTSPWQVEVSGHVNNPGVYGLEDLLTQFDQEERIYRLRCVEAWSMVIPWSGFPLRKLLEKADPTSKAKYVRFETVFDPDNMPGLSSPFYNWPYQEGLRIDEAMHDLTLMATGIYGKELLPQNGAPIRLVVPWKYGFKSIKSIVKIELTEEQPSTLWMTAAPNEYGFYANVNPNVDHPRWSQGSERPIGQFSRIPTLNFNGYEEEVAGLYTGMDLSVNF